MGNDRKIRVAIVGLGFGAEFIPIYQRHPNAEMYAICRRDKKELERYMDGYETDENAPPSMRGERAEQGSKPKGVTAKAAKSARKSARR